MTDKKYTITLSSEEIDYLTAGLLARLSDYCCSRQEEEPYRKLINKLESVCGNERLSKAVDRLLNDGIYEETTRGKRNIKFETGDYAEIVANTSGHQFELGTIVKLEKFEYDYKAFYDGDYWWVIDDDLTEIKL